MILSFALTIFALSSTSQPHILHVIVDDLGWANTNYHREIPDPEVSTPHLDHLVNNGIKLMRHYAFPECTPSRVSFQTGRVPAHIGQSGLCSPQNIDCGIPYNATSISQKMSNAGYSCHFVGKWDCGAATPKHTPYGRNYSSALNYFGHGNYQWGEMEWNGNQRDFWLDDKPAVELANESAMGIYEERIFGERLHGIINSHDASLPLFLVYAARIAHYPIQAPIAYQKRPNIKAIDVPHRLVYHAQIEYLDEQIGNLTAAIIKKNMWNSTLMIFHADNGGYTRGLGPCSEEDPVQGITCTSGEAGANNYPLKGGKYSWFEGGIRVNSFASGGILPKKMRGTEIYGLMHVSDWYTTYCTIAGVDPRDIEGQAAGVPAVEGFNMMPMLLGENSTSPREEIFFGPDTLIQGPWKIMRGSVKMNAWSGPTYPNKSNITLDKFTAKFTNVNPGLFNVEDDMTEHNNLASENPAIVKALLSRLDELSSTIWDNKWTGYESTCNKAAANIKNENFIGPYCLVDFPSPPPPPGPFPPQPLHNCTFLPEYFVSPITHDYRNGTSEEDCCEACGLDANCVAAVLQCKNGNCYCNLKPFNPNYVLEKTKVNAEHTTVTCLTGRQKIPQE